MNTALCLLVSASLSLLALPASSTSPKLVVVHDGGGVSALPYYQALQLKDVGQDPALINPSIRAPIAPETRFSEADMLPVRSARLSPGDVPSREIRAPGLSPTFLIGDDARSRAWLQKHAEGLRKLRAVGFVVHVDSREALDTLRRLAPGLTLAPASGNDIARRLNIQHYPVLVTATRIEQ